MLVDKAEKELQDEEESRILDEDPDLDQLRRARIERLKQEKNKRLENLAKGHGTYEEIVEDQFLKVVLASKFVICHFYHKDFERCKGKRSIHSRYQKHCVEVFPRGDLSLLQLWINT